MRWSTSLGAWARREAVLVSALAGGAAIAALAGPLGVAWLPIAGGIVAAAGALAQLVIAVRRARLEDEIERVELGRLVRVDVAPVGEVDPTLIGIDRAEQMIPPGGGVPDYVRWVADHQLRARASGSGRWSAPRRRSAGRLVVGGRPSGAGAVMDDLGGRRRQQQRDTGRGGRRRADRV